MTADAEAGDGAPGTGVEDSARRCGFVAIVGAPNVGKSTLVNRLVGSKVSIVSPKVQTTRARVLGIALLGETQALLVDTPGLFAPRRRFDQAMVAAAWEGAAGADLITLIVDASRGPQAATEAAPVFDWLRERRHQAVVVLNKVDVAEKSRLLALTAEISDPDLCSAVFMVSALNGDGVADLAAHLARTLPPGPWLYPDDQLSDMPARLLAAEVTREKLFLQLQQELPYSVAVQTESWADHDNGSVRIDQIIWVEREAQRPIVLGRSGQRIKKIGEQARRELESLLDRRVHLFLYVKIREKWRQDPAFYRLHGLNFPE